MFFEMIEKAILALIVYVFLGGAAVVGLIWFLVWLFN